MGRSATLSPLGLYNWDKSLFDLMVIPSGLSRDVLIDNILAETNELEVLYANPTVFKNLLGVWSRKQLPVWEKLYTTTQYDYNPIENYNRYEEGTTKDTGTTSRTGTDTETGAETRTGGDTRTISREQGGQDTVSNSGNNAHYIAAFDTASTGTSDGLAKQTKDENSTSGTMSYGGTEDVTDNVEREENTNTNRSTTRGETQNTSNNGSHSLHMHGNIGVMSTQDMIAQEREIDLFNMYDIIIDEFKQRFCVLVY